MNGSHSTSSCPGHDLLAVGDLDRRAVDDRVALLLAPLVVHDRDLAVAVDDDQVAVLALDGRRRSGTGPCPGSSRRACDCSVTRDAVPP